MTSLAPPLRSLARNTSLRSPAGSLCHQQIRAASGGSKSGRDSKQKAKKKNTRTTFKVPDMKLALQYSLCDAMRYIRAFEVGRPPAEAKYELAIRFRTQKNGPVVRNRLRLPHPVDTSTRICVICEPGSKHAETALAAGATIVGQDDVIQKIKDGEIEFDRCISHEASLPAMNKAGLGRILGPRGLMPNLKTGTVVKDVGKAVRDMMGGSTYRERAGVVRVAVGQLAFTPEEMQKNLRTLMESIKKDSAQLSDRISKESQWRIPEPGVAVHGGLVDAIDAHRAV